MSTNICTWIYLETAEEASKYPQVSGGPEQPRFQAAYWRCVAAFFGTSVRQNPGARHILFSNHERAPAVDGVDLNDWLRGLEVEIIKIPYTYQPPVGYFGYWRNQFYVFDIIEQLASDRVNGPSILLDSDCVWIDSAHGIVDAIEKNGLLTYTVDLEPDWNSNGLSRLDMQALFGQMLGREMAYIPAYCGGEIYAASKEASRRLSENFRPLWNDQIDRFKRGESKLNEEAQALTFLYYKHGYSLGTANPFIKRIWTNLPFRYRNDINNDYGLTIWHLPAEKRWGFKRLFRHVVDPSSDFWERPLGRPLSNYLGSFFGVGHDSLKKVTLDVLELVGRKLTSG